MSRTKEIKVDELLDMYQQVNDRGTKILNELDGYPKEVVGELIEATGAVLKSKSKVALLMALPESEIDQGIQRSKTYLQAVLNAEEIAGGTMPGPYTHTTLQ